MIIQPRRAWTSAPFGFRRYRNRKIIPSQVRAFHPHYPGAGNFSAANDTNAGTAARLRGYRKFHVETRGWADIGYCYAVDQKGNAWELAGKTHAAAHSANPRRPNENAVSMGVLFILGNNERPTAAMLATGAALYWWLRGYFPNMTAIIGHGDIPGAQTACPGPHIRAAIYAGAFKARGPAATPAPSTPAPSKRAKKVPRTKVRVTIDGQLGHYTVLALQTRLRTLGYRGHALDGDPGAYTWISFQQYLHDQGYTGHAIDGRAGRYTWISAQQWLHDIGYTGHAIDGDPGPYTVRSLQHALIDGKVK